jgi:hypothetical protein
LLKRTETVEANFLRVMVTGCDSLADVRVRDFPRLEMALRERLKKVVRKEADK